MKKVIICFLSILCSVVSVAKDYYFKHLGVSDGLSQISISSIYQDEIGAVWLGTSEGLNRYNGKEVKIFRPSQGSEGLTYNEINELCGDKNGTMYIRSGNDLVKLDLYKEQFTCLRQDDVYGIFCEGDTLWVICMDGIYYCTPQNPQLTFFARSRDEWGQGTALYVNRETVWVMSRTHLVAISRSDPSRQESVATFDKGRCVSADSFGNVWVGTWEGLYRVSPDREMFHYTAASGELSDNQVRCVLEDDFGCIWIGTFRGLDCYDPATGTWNHSTRYSDSSNTLSHNSVLALHKDMQGNIWVGTYYGGANVFNPDKTHSHFYHAEPLQEDCLSFPFVGRMTEDSRGNLWICTEGGGLNCYRPDTGKFTRYVHRKGDATSIGSDNPKSIFYRKENDRLYVGTHLGGLYVFDPKTGKGHTLYCEAVNPASLSHTIVNEIQEYRNGLALLTQAGPVYLDPETERFSPLSQDARIQELLRKEYAYETFFIDSRQRMWLALGMGGMVCIHLPSSRVDRYVADAANPMSIGKFKIDHIFEDSRGDVYFCTVGSGMFKFEEDSASFKVYNVSSGILPSDYCYYLGESVRDRCLYLLHSKGLSIFDPAKETVEHTYHLFQQSYSQGSALYRDASGTIFIGGTNGLAFFQEQFLYRDSPSSYLNFDKLLIFNREIHPNDGTGILSNVLAKTSAVYLGYDQNNIFVEFATFNYRYDRNLLFEYRLDGFDKTWTQTAGTTLTYTNLPPGNYTLRVRQLDNRHEATKEILLDIHVAAPFYATPWAYLAYLLLFVGLTLFFIRFKTRQAALKSSLEFERKEKERMEELNQTKLRFFTNISHEFRTPLTLILGQIEVLMQMDKLGPAVYNRILRIYKNAWHMRNLISELLDFRKQEQGYLKLKVEEQNLVAFTRQIYMCFYEYSQKKGINYRFEPVEESILVWFDPVQLQKVIFNLLSNAFKYTPEKGTIIVDVRKTSSQVTVSVSDTGRGIPEEYIYKIFERFYQTDTVSSCFTLGTGIGLALSKGIMDMHHGKIDVKSKVGQGTIFTLVLPLGNRHFTEEELSHPGGNEVTTLFSGERLPVVPFYEPLETEANAALNEDEQTDKPAILLVEDNEELLSMLGEVFSPMYDVHTARNGREGLDMARRIQPDLIVSDVMMPEMSGKEMCYKIKNNVELSHISVVLLTAQTSVEYVVEGFMFGADDYVTKPFNVKVLVARCNNLIKNKKRLIAHYAGKPVVETTEADAVTERDKELLEKCVGIVRENFENVDFDVTALASRLCMGRSKLYMQFKQMTGLTPNEFILKVKLDEAMNLLKNRPELNISEISVRLGFSSPRYFSKCFKAFFGVAPQGIRKKE